MGSPTTPLYYPFKGSLLICGGSKTLGLELELEFLGLGFRV